MSENLTGLMVRVLLLLLWSGSTWAGPAIIPETATGTIADLEESIRGVVTRSGIPGAGFALVNRQGTIWAGGVGLAHVATGRKVASGTLFRVGSITKTFVAVSMLQLQERGEVRLTDRVSALVPEVKISNPWEETDPVLLEQVLEHTAGFNEISPAQWISAAGGQGLQAGQPFLASARICRWRPGTRYSYSNTGAVIAGVIIEKVSSEPFQQYVSRHILQPLGMNRACLRFEEASDGDMARSYRRDGVTEIPPRPSRFPPTGALIASPAEMAQFVRMLILRGSLDGREILRPISVDRMEKPGTTLGARAGIECGYGLGIQGIFRHGFLFRGHGGMTSGFLSEFGYLPDQGLGYFFVVNATHDVEAVNEIGGLITEVLTRNLPRPTFPDHPIDPASLASLAGYYEPITPRVEGTRFATRLVGIKRVQPTSHGLVVSSLLGSVWTPAKGFGDILDLLIKPLFLPAFDLMPAGPDRFRRVTEPVASVIFLRDPDGAMVMQTCQSTLRRIPAWLVFGQHSLMMLVVTLMLSAGLLAFLWIPRLLRHGAGNVAAAGARFSALVPGACISLVIVLWGCGGDRALELFGNPTALSVSIWLLSWVFVGSSLLGPIVILRLNPPAGSRWVWVHSLLVSLANALLAAYLLYWGQFHRSWVP